MALLCNTKSHLGQFRICLHVLEICVFCFYEAVVFSSPMPEKYKVDISSALLHVYSIFYLHVQRNRAHLLQYLPKFTATLNMRLQYNDWKEATYLSASQPFQNSFLHYTGHLEEETQQVKEKKSLCWWWQRYIYPKQMAVNVQVELVSIEDIKDIN